MRGDYKFIFPMAFPLYTIGYASFSPADLIKRLLELSVRAVVDTRAEPHVSSFPAYRQPAIKKFLTENKIYYLDFGAELGARPRLPELYSDGRADFSKIAAWEPFRRALERVRKGLEKFPVCLMCAQKDPLNCHRSILLTREFRALYPEVAIAHILSPEDIESEEALRERLTRARGGGQLFLGAGADALGEAYRERERKIAYCK